MPKETVSAIITFDLSASLFLQLYYIVPWRTHTGLPEECLSILVNLEYIDPMLSTTPLSGT